MITYVVDTNVLVKYVAPEEHSEAAWRIISLYQREQLRLVAPDYIMVECANVLWKYVRRGTFSVPDAVSALRTLRGLGIPLVPHAELLEDALAFAGETGIVVYDALFAVLARREDTDLITADIPLVNRLVGTGIGTLALTDALSDWAEPPAGC